MSAALPGAQVSTLPPGCSVPLLSQHVFDEATFSPTGRAAIRGGNTLDKLVRRNTAPGAVQGPITLTRSGWTRRR